jgi:membrane-bound lytic murein transglycosylase A
MQKRSLLILCLLIISSCARAPLKHIEDSMRPASSPPVLTDSLSKESFFSALNKHLAVMKKSNQVQDPMIFGQKKIKKADYIASLEKILEHENDWLNWVTLNFDLHEAYGREDWSEVMVTGYYEPRVKGAHTESAEFSQPLYATPKDLFTVNLKKFAGKFPKGEKLGVLQGRLENRNLVPYYDRKEIDEDKKIKEQSIVLAWVDPVDAFFIQIQGSGVVEFSEHESMRVGYDGQNGHAYLPIGRVLTHVIPLEQMSMQKIRIHLNSLTKEERQKVMNNNPSYVFFKKLDGLALTYAGMEVEDGRTIATDLHLFPKGAMAFLDIEEPEFNSITEVEASTWQSKPRIVFDQDTGGAIRGGDRVDLYFGQGAVAAQKAGVMKQKGKLYYLAPKK